MSGFSYRCLEAEIPGPEGVCSLPCEVRAHGVPVFMGRQAWRWLAKAASHPKLVLLLQLWADKASSPQATHAARSGGSKSLDSGEGLEVHCGPHLPQEG